MKIGNLEIDGNLILAPMAGYSEVGMRSLAVSFGASYAVCEMVSAKALNYGSKKTENLLITDENEKIKVVQLFGSNAEDFAKVMNHSAISKFDIIDINMGCPVKKLVKNKEGASLMRFPNNAKKIIEACVKNSNKPITVKFRAGFESETAAEFAKMCEEAGASAITVHGRTAKQMYGGKADLDVIKRVKQAVKIPVIANGDVCDRKSYLNILSHTGADAVMVGRAAIGRPWIFAEILNDGFVLKSKKEIVLLHFEILKKYNAFNVNEFKKHLAAYLKGEHNAAELRHKIFETKSVLGLEKLIKTIYN